MSARYIVGDSLTVLRSLPDASVDLVLSSPPFLGLRSYLPADHPDKAAEMGSEATPGEFIDALLVVVEECRRVLAPHGSLCFELGDTYAGSGGAGGDYGTLDPGAKGLREGQPKFEGSAIAARRTRNANRQSTVSRRRDQAEVPRQLPAGDGWPLDKSLCLVPELLRVAIVYGFNPLTGRETPRWRARNVVRWCRPNPPVGALADKVRPATSDMIVACVGRKRYFDLDAVREPIKASTADRAEGARRLNGKSLESPTASHGRDFPVCQSNPAGAPPLDHWWFDEDSFDHWWFDEDSFEQDAWLVSTEPYKGSHYATWPTDLLVRPIEAMCPRRVCTTCGAPSERIVETNGTGQNTRTSHGMADDPRQRGAVISTAVPEVADRKTLGWTDCGHGTWRNGVVLDPFGGSGTTAVVALGHGRDALLIDLDERNADLARERVGMWLTVEHHNAAKTVA